MRSAGMVPPPGFPAVARDAAASSLPDLPAWRRWEREVRGCHRCPFAATRTHPVLYRGAPHPSVLFLGEAPGAEEDRRGVPFVGRAGRLLDQAIARVGLSTAEIGVANLLKCRPPLNHFDPAAARRCRPFLDRQIELLAPSRIVTLGRHPLHALVPGAPPILAAAGAPIPGHRPPVFPLLHPAAALRSRAFAARWQSDLLRLREWLHPPEMGQAH
ncbi:MAG: uracil-DNA glycosylase [Thermoplasmata archaeon]